MEFGENHIQKQHIYTCTLSRLYVRIEISVLQLRLFVNGAKVEHSITYEYTNYSMVKKLVEGGMYVPLVIIIKGN